MLTYIPPFQKTCIDPWLIDVLRSLSQHAKDQSCFRTVHQRKLGTATLHSYVIVFIILHVVPSMCIMKSNQYNNVFVYISCRVENLHEISAIECRSYAGRGKLNMVGWREYRPFHPDDNYIVLVWL